MKKRKYETLGLTVSNDSLRDDNPEYSDITISLSRRLSECLMIPPRFTIEQKENTNAGYLSTRSFTMCKT
jgi:hypothetical protein